MISEILNTSNVFQNLIVIDLSTVLAGPSVGSFFAELGAKVIKIEHPIYKDVTRTWKLPSESKEGISAYFSSVNYKKEYYNLDLKNTEDYQCFLNLVENADILLSNFKKGDEEKMKIGNDVLRTLNPKLIRGKISGFGDHSDRVAYDLILQAETGFMSMNGTPNSGPVKMPVALIDVLAAHHLKEGLLLSLYLRETSMIIKDVSVSLYDAAVCSLMNQASNFLMSQHIPKRIGSLHPNIAPYGEIFLTKDGQWITFAIGSDSHFAKLCSFLCIDHIARDPRFENNPSRVSNRSALFNILENEVKKFEAEKILGAMLEQHVPCGKIRNIAEVFNDPMAKRLIREDKIGDTNTKRLSAIAFEWN